MSLKIFHIVFTGFTTLLFLFLGIFYGMRFSDSGNTLLLIYSIISIILGMGCILYGRNFMNKYKHFSNL
tara:strand:+ start:113 stop:319 length:207 start_codon:yes stop_codon:yes gene_type:complete